MNTFMKGTDVLYKYVQLAALILLVLTMSLLFVQTLLRFILNIALPWAEELCRYMCIWLSFLGGGIGIRKGVHVGFDLIKNRLPAKIMYPVNIIVHIIILVVACALVRGGWELTKQAMNQTSSSLGISMAWIYSSLIVGGILIMIYGVESILMRRAKTI